MWCKQMIHFPGLCEKWLLAHAFSFLFNNCTCLHAAWEFMPMALVRNKAFLLIFFLLWHLCPLTCFTEAVTSSLPKQQRKPLPAMGACGASVGVEKGTQHSNCHYSFGNKKHLPELRAQILTTRRKRKKSQHFPLKGGVCSSVPTASPP